MQPKPSFGQSLIATFWCLGAALFLVIIALQVLASSIPLLTGSPQSAQVISVGESPGDRYGRRQFAVIELKGGERTTLYASFNSRLGGPPYSQGQMLTVYCRSAQLCTSRNHDQRWLDLLTQFFLMGACVWLIIEHLPVALGLAAPKRPEEE